MILVSLHLPKTAGTSFLALLEQVYGDALLRDYADRPLHSSPWRRKKQAITNALCNLHPGPALLETRCVHGHFLPLKYRGLALRLPLRFVTWLRDPVERLASHFHYWQRSYDRREAGPLHRRCVEEGWDLERFCLGPELRNSYSSFLWGFPLKHFDFVGITEHYEDDVRVFSEQFFGALTQLPAPRNVNERGAADSFARPYIEDPGFRRRVEAYHARDMALYRTALAMREARCRHD